MSELWGGDDARPFRAHISIDCLITQCPGRMELNMLRADGTLLQRPFNNGPFYRCTRVGCYYQDHPRGLHTLNSEWVRDVNVPKKQTEIKVTGE
jgi:hypothetical protein